MKLKALMLVGFKSFADKTTFEFHDGVTCVVGPNGCGKSNVVDAFKWVLGEQSAKSLRGGQMQDVIFNGTPQRRSAGFAEVALTFEDAAGVLGQFSEDTKDPIVIIARRLYRSGESEYFINKKPARLKDVREMFLDTGIGVDAYSLIEQGKVEMFLQSSPDARRVVFDEAAGISRYKARKREACRRLERVEQNLLRLTDILAEVQKRLRSIKYQAGKARSYQTHSVRLSELRSLYSQAEYHRLSTQRREIQSQADAVNDAISGLRTQISQLQTAGTAAEVERADMEKKAHELDGRLLGISGEVKACQQRGEMLATRVSELADEIAAETARCEKLEGRVQAKTGQIEAQRRQLTELEAELVRLAERHKALAGQQVAEQDALRKKTDRLEDEKNGTIELLRRTAQLHNEINTHMMRRENLHSQRTRLHGRSEEIAHSLQDLYAQRTALATKLTEADAVIAASKQRLDATHARDRQLEESAGQARAELSRAKQDRSALESRRAVLEEMQDRLEGVGEGVRRVLTAAREGRAPFIRGMLGECIETDVVHAGVIEAALAGAEQRLLVDRLEDVTSETDRLKEMLEKTDGVELICLDRLPDAQPSLGPVGVEGVIARASDWVRCDREGPVGRVVEMLLGRTLVVDSLARAFELSARLGRGWRFVTTGGEVVEPDGRVCIGGGSRQVGGGVIWRRSELNQLQAQLADGGERIAALTAGQNEIRAEQEHVDEQVHVLRTAIYEANTERVEHQTHLEQLAEKVQGLEQEAPLVAEEVRQLAGEIEATAGRAREAGEAAERLEALRRERESEIARLTQAVEVGGRRVEALTGEATAAQVALAQATEKRDVSAQTIDRLAGEGQAVAQELADSREEIAAARQRREQAEQGAGQARHRIEALARQRAALTRDADENAESRKSLVARAEEIRGRLAGHNVREAEQKDKLNDLRVGLGEVEVRIESLISRTAEELNMDLPALYANYTHDEQRDWDAVEAEIGELRAKIERLGNVNLDAIAEQDELQKREEFLDGQIQDIRSSQRQLAELIKRINAESRRRFEESFEAVRANFNDLFRKLFGGGKADILLTDADDVLESGIEIVARPPGKDLRAITLLSGGEKTMTALALLFSFFKSRPSPFCLLDEVDAALDEANTQRFVHLVREFLDTSQFVIISHAKRTIAMADQIYGVTMQKPGVSTRISVRFDQAAELAETPGAAVVA